MEFYQQMVTLSEVPDHISLCFSVKGCSLKCNECSWSDLTDYQVLTKENFINLLNHYNGYISCVCFLGGEWYSSLVIYLEIAKARNLSTCLYTGLELKDVDTNILKLLDYVKTGKWIKELGGLRSLTTNQKFFDLKTNSDITYKFQRSG